MEAKERALKIYNGFCKGVSKSNTPEVTKKSRAKKASVVMINFLIEDSGMDLIKDYWVDVLKEVKKF